MQFNKYVIPAVIALAIITSFFVIKPFIIPLLAGTIIAYTFRPIYNRVLKYVKSPTLSSVLVTLFILAIVTIPAIFIVNTISRETYVLRTGKRAAAEQQFLSMVQKRFVPEPAELV